MYEIYQQCSLISSKIDLILTVRFFCRLFITHFEFSCFCLFLELSTLRHILVPFPKGFESLGTCPDETSCCLKVRAPRRGED
eukprot:UN11985